MKKRSIVFVHGMYMTPLCWEHWVDFFGSRGFRCLAPAWPGRDVPVEELRKRGPGPLTLRMVIEHIAETVRGLDENPVLIGHSMGALVTQALLQRDLAAAAVAIDSAPPLGVLTTRWSFLRSNWPHITPFVHLDEPVEMTFERFCYTFVNSLPAEEQRAAFDRYVVPESRRVPREALTGVARIDFKKPGAPLLLIAGGADNIIPASLNRTNFARYHRPGSVTDFKVFPGRTHFIIGQKNWEEVAGYVLGWLAGLPAQP